MIEINHCGFGESIDVIYSKVIGTEMMLKMNTKLINQDIEKLKELLNNSSKTNRINRANISALIAYLEKMQRLINDDCELELCWHKNKNSIVELYPVKMCNEVMYGINTCNYVELSSNENMIILNLQDMADIIAFEYIFRELGEDHDSIEEIMKDCNFIGYNSASVLTDKFKQDKDKPYALSKVMKISNSPWVDTNTNLIYDYFSTQDFTADKYHKVVEYSCMHAALIIASRLIKKCIKKNIDYKLIMVSATTIAILIDNTAKIDVEKELLESVSLQAFGRQLLIDTDTQIF